MQYVARRERVWAVCGWGGRLVIQPEYQRNYIYSGPFVAAAKEEFSNSNNSNLQKWKSY